MPHPVPLSPLYPLPFFVLPLFRRAQMQHAVRYVEEGLMSLTAMNQSDDPHDLDKDAPQNELEKEVCGEVSLFPPAAFAPLESTASLASRSRPSLLAAGAPF